MKKKLLKTLDKILNCCIFASLFNFKQQNKSKIVITTKTKKR